jgi:signal peptide peptidase SppA
MRRAAGNAGLFTEPAKPAPVPDLLTVENGVGIVSIVGVLMKRPDFFSRLLLGGTDMEDIEAALIAARDRADVQAVFLDVDSPGGTVNGTPELAALVADVSKAKYTYAFTDGQMCSAAYWIASQADAIFATPSARVGSIGVLLPVLDESEAFKQAGLKVELFAAGKFKSIGVEGTTLTDEQRTWIQAQVDETYGDFKAAVLARGRRITPDVMEGQSFSGRKASYNSLTSGVVQDRTTALMKLRERHVKQPVS